MIKNVIFDLDDTLLDFERGEIEGVTTILKENGVTDIKHGLDTYLKINNQVWEEIEKGAARQPLLNTRFSKSLALLGKQVDGVAVEHKYRNILGHNYYQINGASKLLSQLKENGINLLVGSNGVKQTQISRLQGSGLDKYFTKLFISEDIGYAKPDKRFFDTILADKQITKDNTIMVGDRLQSDILGASRANLRSIWYNPSNQVNQLEIKPTYTVSNYEKLADIILKEAE
ncbi:YjjG family noncanonical pyrimidine nucleotidase [Lentilactobacillus sp. Marseille-Q4993]|uniref:YjjG family noncanonical pyrimidine nucleotidase n=1 Tax=Lentilactobacillus sp. Marseille-Q4993 TaxID=3039492 RepID=UPI0024BC999B|nr:YjjG family noncanonical pyrimidine nucleotidase [Lentilactobacillus sp. Marseille-Q4993]